MMTKHLRQLVRSTWLVAVAAVFSNGCTQSMPPDGREDQGTADLNTTTNNDANRMAQMVVYISGNNNRIATAALDMTTGSLTPKTTVSSGGNAGFLALHPQKKYLYAITDAGSGRVAAFSLDPTTGSLAALNDVASGGDCPAHLSVHPSGKWVMVAHYTSGHVAILPILADGRLGAAIQTLFAGAKAHQIIAEGAGKYALVPCLGSDWIGQYRMGPDGTLTPNDPAVFLTKAGGGPRHIAFHPGGQAAYLLNETDSTLTSLAYNPGNGLLGNPQTISAGANSDSAEVQVAPSGRFVYTSNRGNNTIAIFAIHPSTLRASFLSTETGGGTISRPRHFSIDPTGTFLLVANQSANNVTVFRIGNDGALTKLGSPFAFTAPTFVQAVSLP